MPNEQNEEGELKAPLFGSLEFGALNLFVIWNL
jgi:hypothetical protein